jgi:hypothetical protein
MDWKYIDNYLQFTINQFLTSIRIFLALQNCFLEEEENSTKTASWEKND